MSEIQNKFLIRGMTCSMCSQHVETAVRKIHGVKHVNVNLVSNSMNVTYDNNISTAEIIKAVKNAGYSAKLISDDTNKNSIKSEITKIIYELVITAVIVLLSVNSNTSNYITNGCTQFILTLIVCALNYKLFTRGFKNLFKNPTMDSLVAIGVSSAFVFSSYTLFYSTYYDSFLQENLYFDTAAMIQTIIGIGKWIELRSKLKVSNNIHSLLSSIPKQATRITDAKEEKINVSDLKYGDLIRIKPGEQIPADGIIIEGSSTINESMITGESIPAFKTIGNIVYAGTINFDGIILFKVNACGEETTIAKIINMVNKAIQTKAPLTRAVDKICKYFVPTIITIALFTFIGWMYHQSDLTNALMHSISVLMVSCPCALGLATPLSITIGLGIGAKNNILFKSSEAIENLFHIKAIAFDKTGTVTEGKMVVQDIFPLADIDKKKLLTIASSCESSCDHPLAISLVKYAEEHNIKFKTANNFIYTVGQGISAIIEGQEYFVGNQNFIQNNCYIQKFDYSLQNTNEKIILYVAKKNKLLGVITFNDAIKKNMHNTIEELAKQKINIYMMSGDRINIVQNIGCQIGIKIERCFGDLLPSDKAYQIAEIKKIHGLTAMIGDGINDAPALAEADIGISIGSGLDVTKNSSDLILGRDNPNDLLKAIKLSKQVVSNIYENLFWGLIYNVLSIPIAIGLFDIELTPIMASILMCVSSLCVIANASRLFLWKYNSQNG